MAAHAVPDEILERAFACVAVTALGRCSAACRQWRRIAQSDALWLPAITSCGKLPYSTAVTEAGAATWLARELGGDIPSSRGHLRRLQSTRDVWQLYRFLRCFHNGVEVEPHTAKRAQTWYNGALVNAAITLEVLNFWPHESWLLIRRIDPEEDNGWPALDGPPPPDVSLAGGSARIRAWDTAVLPPGRLGKGLCYLLDCGPRGELFRIPPLATLEIGAHKISGHAAIGCHLRLQCTMGQWQPEIGVPLPACSPDAFLHSTSGDSAAGPSDDEDADPAVSFGAQWLEGCPLPASCSSLGPVLYQTVVDLDLSPWL